MGALAGRRSHFVLAEVMPLLFGCSNNARKLVLDAALVANVILTSILVASLVIVSLITGIAAASATETGTKTMPDSWRRGWHIEPLCCSHQDLAPRAPAKRRISREFDRAINLRARRLNWPLSDGLGAIHDHGRTPRHLVVTNPFGQSWPLYRKTVTKFCAPFRPVHHAD